MRNLLVVTAALEMGAGAALIGFPSWTASLLLGSPLETHTALVVGRLAGTALLTLGIASWLIRFDATSVAARGFVGAMVVYNLGAAAILGITAFQLQASHPIAWVAALLHAAMAAWCCRSLLRVDRGPLRSMPGEF